MSRVVVDLARLASFIDRVERFQAVLSAACADADARVREMHETWTGGAAASQASAQSQWRAGAAEVHAALAALRAAALLAHGNYTAAASANRRMWAL